MAFNLKLLEKHKYATGAVIIVGGIAVFYLLSRGGSAPAATSSGNGDILAADASLAQTQAAAAVQTNGQNAALQVAQINAQSTNLQTSAAEDVTNTQTLAALVAALSGNKTNIAVTQSNNDAAVAMNADTLTAQQNIFSIQEAGLEDQINQAAQENANNNATSLAGLVDTLNYQGQIATQVIGSATQLATQKESDTQQNTQALIPSFGKTYNSALDANNANAEILTVLSGGNPVVANTGVQSSVPVAQSGNAATASILNSITKLGASIGAGLFA